MLVTFSDNAKYRSRAIFFFASFCDHVLHSFESHKGSFWFYVRACTAFIHECYHITFILNVFNSSVSIVLLLDASPEAGLASRVWLQQMCPMHRAGSLHRTSVCFYEYCDLSHGDNLFQGCTWCNYITVWTVCCGALCSCLSLLFFPLSFFSSINDFIPSWFTLDILYICHTAQPLEFKLYIVLVVTLRDLVYCGIDQQLQFRHAWETISCLHD